MHGGYKSGVYSKDNSGCPARSGNLKKVNPGPNISCCFVRDIADFYYHDADQ